MPHIYYWEPISAATPNYPSESDVREGVSFGDGETGTLVMTITNVVADSVLSAPVVEDCVLSAPEQTAILEGDI
jgi:hypothetical protein